MVVASKMGPQDMPPPGGYNPIQTERIKLRKLFTAPLTVGLVLGLHFAGMYIYSLTHTKILNEKLERRSARFATVPVILAERDRAFLKQLKKNRDHERELMKNDPDWEVGTYYGEPIFITRPEEEFREPEFQEFYAHASYTDTIMHRLMRRHLC